MKKHLVSLWFSTPSSGDYAYNGMITAIERNGKTVIDANKLFKSAFGFELPAHTIISNYIPADLRSELAIVKNSIY